MISERPRKQGATDQSVVIRIIDSGDGTPETGVVYNTSGIDLWYRRDGAAKTSITEATLSALTDAHSDGGILHIGDGYYRIDLPDAAVASGVNGVVVGGTVTGMIVIGCLVPLVPYDPYTDVIGTPTDLGSGATLSANLVDIEAQTDDIGAAGAGLTAADDAILAILGALNTAAATGDPDSSTTLMGYVKAIVNALYGANGVVTWPSGAAPGNAVSLAEGIRRIHDYLSGSQTMTEAYAADGAALSIPNALYLIAQVLTEASVSGTSITVKKRDGSTTAVTLTINDATTPTSITHS